MRHHRHKCLLRRASKTVEGFDLTFSAPTSVSVGWALADGPLRDSFHAAHRAEIEDVIAYAERPVLVTRADAGGVVWAGRGSREVADDRGGAGLVELCRVTRGVVAARMTLGSTRRSAAAGGLPSISCFGRRSRAGENLTAKGWDESRTRRAGIPRPMRERGHA